MQGKCLPKAPVQPSTYLVTSGAEVGRTVFLRASIQFLRMPEVIADKVYTASLVCKSTPEGGHHVASPMAPSPLRTPGRAALPS